MYYLRKQTYTEINALINLHKILTTEGVLGETRDATIRRYRDENIIFTNFILFFAEHSQVVLEFAVHLMIFDLNGVCFNANVKFRNIR